VTTTDRPIPVPDATSEPFWAAAAAHTLVLARCARCHAINHPPGAVCASCGTTDPAFEFTPAEGNGVVRSWTIVRQSFLPGFGVPFVLVDVELSAYEDVRLIGRLIDGADAPLRVGLPVSLLFEDIAPGVAVPAFALEPTA
jgi:hypothetical protein